jgi:hypothetical protein
MKEEQMTVKRMGTAGRSSLRRNSTPAAHLITLLDGAVSVAAKDTALSPSH